VTAPWVEIREARDRDGDLYRVTLTIAQAREIPDCLFVLERETDAFNRVASVPDLEVLPRTSEDAFSQHQPRYLSATATKSFERPGALVEFLSHVRLRITDLTQVWAGEVDLDIPGLSVYTLPSEPM